MNYTPKKYFFNYILTFVFLLWVKYQIINAIPKISAIPKPRDNPKVNEMWVLFGICIIVKVIFSDSAEIFKSEFLALILNL